MSIIFPRSLSHHLAGMQFPQVEPIQNPIDFIGSKRPPTVDPSFAVFSLLYFQYHPVLP